MRFQIFLMTVGITLIKMTNCAPHKVEKKAGHFPVTHETADPVAALTALKPPMWRLQPATIPKDKKESSFPLVRKMSSSNSRIMQEINGERKEVERQEEQVS